ncbi:hypothetical protein J2Z76_002420 [Sedimentibacter acidaminivorans]|uniref:Uncharacterized protein n=1 Tax=Sedimentibacter acidaminivorans TaxID=913099 RepID=A0ABS4GFU3_9FIRM|nr:hypothetical protein [Sedimentibacter acidaminivorans]MBP1926551.1 hypothetical protein [Sedimentibacter acidaminivorans]
MLHKKETDLNSLLKMQDVIDILYRINRIKDNSYDQNLKGQLDNMPPLDRAQNIIKYISKNSDDMTKKNADIFINILKNINEVNHNGSNFRNRNNNKNHKIYRTNSNPRNYPIIDNNSFVEKIKNILKLLNDE